MSRLQIIDPEKTTVVHIQRKKGVVVQDCDVYIGRAVYRGGWELPQSIWHNPFHRSQAPPEFIGRELEWVISSYRKRLLSSPELLARLPELKGKRLGCWCKPGPCHGDILVEMVNKLT